MKPIVSNVLGAFPVEQHCRHGRIAWRMRRKCVALHLSGRREFPDDATGTLWPWSDSERLAFSKPSFPVGSVVRRQLRHPGKQHPAVPPKRGHVSLLAELFQLLLVRGIVEPRWDAEISRRRLRERPGQQYG